MEETLPFQNIADIDLKKLRENKFTNNLLVTES